MLSILMIRTARARARFYRVDVSHNLFGEYSVVRAWGASGQAGRQLLVWFSNLREACIAAERWQHRARTRGYQETAI
jgi:predicted DNA-binding WGR domain protein